MNHEKEDKLNIKNFLEEEKVSDIRAYNNGEWINIVVGTVRSQRHISGILKKIKVLKIIKKEDVFGIPENEWVICSVEGIDIHLFTKEKRDYYGIDNLWEQWQYEQ
ncbi:RsfS/YbeB/iojap family protein [Alphaproteobacteria bacterium endosymbiont of Tiliacea citrago]|uniref:RsfS/YbeB/iojap family protein n=1 Tax=Alphaproteobacteria bacterium endosymbiont of Tiliacea citrago TaxID=3077944 RepID=UPI00313B4576